MDWWTGGLTSILPSISLGDASEEWTQWGLLWALDYCLGDGRSPGIYHRHVTRLGPFCLQQVSIVVWSRINRSCFNDIKQ